MTFRGCDAGRQERCGLWVSGRVLRNLGPPVWPGVLHSALFRGRISSLAIAVDKQMLPYPPAAAAEERWLLRAGIMPMMMSELHGFVLFWVSFSVVFSGLLRPQFWSLTSKRLTLSLTRCSLFCYSLRPFLIQCLEKNFETSTNWLTVLITL